MGVTYETGALMAYARLRGLAPMTVAVLDVRGCVARPGSIARR